MNCPCPALAALRPEGRPPSPVRRLQHRAAGNPPGAAAAEQEELGVPARGARTGSGACSSSGWVDVVRRTTRRSRASIRSGRTAASARENDIGWRIDHVLASPKCCPARSAPGSRRRAGLSDHAPVWVEIDDRDRAGAFSTPSCLEDGSGARRARSSRGRRGRAPRIGDPGSGAEGSRTRIGSTRACPPPRKRVHTASPPVPSRRSSETIDLALWSLSAQETRRASREAVWRPRT